MGDADGGKMILADEEWIEQLVAEALRPRGREPIERWCERHVRMPYSARQEEFSLSLSPYLREPLRYCQGDQFLDGHRVEMVTVVGSVQSSKSALTEAFSAWTIAENPGPTQWNFQDEGTAKEQVSDRLMPLFYATKPVAEKMPDGRALKVLSIRFRDMFLIIQGAESRANLQTKSIKTQINDEVYLWPDLHLSEAWKRCEAYNWCRMIVNISTGGVVGDQLYDAYYSGAIFEWQFKCRKCGCVQPWRIKRKGATGGITWSADARHADGTWDYRQAAMSVCYECIHCQHRYANTIVDKREMAESACYVRLDNPDAIPGRVSFTYPSWPVEWSSWGGNVSEFLKANEAAKKGVFGPLKEFTQKRLGTFWEERGIETAPIFARGNFRMKDVSWSDAAMTFLCADVQKDHYMVVSRQFATDGRNRLVYAGRCDTVEDLRDLQLDLGITIDRCVGLDAAWGQLNRGSRAVFYDCCRYGWTALLGSDKPYFTRRLRGRGKSGKPIISAVGRQQMGDPLVGRKRSDRDWLDERKMKTRYCPLFAWSNQMIKDIYEEHIRGRGPESLIAADTPDEWCEHVSNEVRRVTHGALGRARVQYAPRARDVPLHLRDADLMCFVLASIGGLLGEQYETTGGGDDAKTEEEKVSV